MQKDFFEEDLNFAAEKVMESLKYLVSLVNQDRYKSWKRRFKDYKYNHHMIIEFAADNKRLGQVLYAFGS